jgi:CRISPR-associated protein Cmr2
VWLTFYGWNFKPVLGEEKMSNNKTFEVLQEIEIQKINNLNSYIAFCKYNFKNNKAKNKKLNKLKNKLKSLSKIFIINNSENNSGNPIQKIQNISGIITDKNNIKNLIESLPKYSFTVWVKFKLLEPYFSRDDDEFYIIQNPILKETAFKVPMVRGSSWKGALAGAFKKLLNDEDNNKSKIIESYLRIFGAGSESIKAIEEYLKEKSKELEEFKDKVLEFMLFELGMEIKKEDIDEIKTENDRLKLIQKLKSKISNRLEKSQSNLPIEFQTHKGRAIFYPTYFDKISLEIINPHDRRKRAGTVPIHYEVVPSGTEGILQVVYIPLDGVLKRDDELKEEVKQDLENLCQAIDILADEGIGAKTKLGWGRFDIEDKDEESKGENQEVRKIYCINSNEYFDVTGWERCQV